MTSKPNTTPNPNSLDNVSSTLCYCGSPASLQSNAIKYGREYGNGLAWICDRFPECDGYVGTHPDGSPLGTLADKETVELRKQVHALIDPLWLTRTDRSKKRNRGSVYGWLRRIMDMTPDECHVGNWTAEQCDYAIKQIAANPYQVSVRSGLHSSLNNGSGVSEVPMPTDLGEGKEK